MRSKILPLIRSLGCRSAWCAERGGRRNQQPVRPTKNLERWFTLASPHWSLQGEKFSDEGQVHDVTSNTHFVSMSTAFLLTIDIEGRSGWCVTKSTDDRARFPFRNIWHTKTPMAYAEQC
eukprot:scaffold75_cov165-Amphora_coffeaeformis.AAC.16